MNLTVGELKKKLAELPDDMPIGKVGHFGEMHFMTSSNFYIRRAYWNINPKTKKVITWRGVPGSQRIEAEVLDICQRIEAEVLDICLPDIGEEPE